MFEQFAEAFMDEFGFKVLVWLIVGAVCFIGAEIIDNKFPL